MEAPVTEEGIRHIENYLGQGDIDAALPELLELRDAVEDYVKDACVTTDEVQFFSFADTFERLAYRRVERDPRTLVQVDAPFDRVYADLAFAYSAQREYGLARDALKQAVRWDPMNCAYRLDLAELYRVLGNEDEWGALAYSVLERAADAVLFGRACAALGQFFLNREEPLLAAGYARRAAAFAPREEATRALLERLMQEAPDAAEASDEETARALGEQGLSAEPNAEIAICLLMCATDAARAGDRDAATRYTLRARDLVGEDACSALIRLIRESDAELASEREAGAGGSDPAAPQDAGEGSAHAES